jgi:hypothetical protein
VFHIFLSNISRTRRERSGIRHADQTPPGENKNFGQSGQNTCFSFFMVSDRFFFGSSKHLST